tara:strand:- start:4127 stop:5617 length:1491 start_codon:yes stop_codon:yes gene_type:complete
MKPTNLDSLPCTPTSSNCVIWQGPDLPCIKLCKGDTISDVVYKMAVELCKLFEDLNVDNYNLECFGLDNCAPENFQQLFQFVLDQLCPPVTELVTATGDPCDALDCIVAVNADCFQSTLGTSTTLAIYVAAMASEICALVMNIGNLSPQVQLLGAKVAQLEIDLDAEKKAAQVLPTMVPVCVLGNNAGATKIDVVLQALEQQFCELRATTGIPNEILAAIAKQCSNLDELAGTGKITQLSDWSQSATAAGAINNIWLTICDVRSAVLNIQESCCGSGCDDLQIGMTAVSDDVNLTLFFTGSLPDGWIECGTMSQQLTITDCTGGMKITNIGITTSLNDPAGYQIPLSSISPPINSACNLNLSLLACFKDPASTSECQKVLQTVVYNSATCPDLSLVSTLIDVNYTVDYITIGTIDLVVEIWDIVTNVLVASDGYVGLNGPFQQLGVFTGLTSGRQYKVRTLITVGDKQTICPWVTTTTLSEDCATPIDVTSTITIT